MTPAAVHLVQSSFHEVALDAAMVADLFYDRPFDIAPDARLLFPADLGDQKRKLTQVLGVAVNGLSRPEEIGPAVQALGRRHGDYGVEVRHDDSVGAALLWALERGLGDGLTPETRAARIEAHAMLSGMMIAAQREAELA